MIVTKQQYTELQHHLMYAWLKWASTNGIKLTIAVSTDSGQDLYILGPHINVYTDAITINQLIIPYSRLVGLYDLENAPLIETTNVREM